MRVRHTVVHVLFSARDSMHCAAKQQHKQSRRALGASQVTTSVCRRHQARAKGAAPQHGQNPQGTHRGVHTSCSLMLQLRVECCDTETQTCTQHLLKAACAVTSGLTRVCKPDALSFGVENNRLGPTQDTNAGAWGHKGEHAPGHTSRLSRGQPKEHRRRKSTSL